MMAAMQPVDFTKVLDNATQPRALPEGATPDTAIYGGHGGIQFRSREHGREFTSDTVRLSDRAYLFATEAHADRSHQQRQIVQDGDWIHIQFRLSGGGRECIARNVIETPEKSCVVARYPENTLIERTLDRTAGWRVACLFISPKAMTELLDVSASSLPDSVQWIASECQSELRTSVLPLQSAMALAVNDILACAFRGSNRRTYMRAKSLELLATVIHALDAAAARNLRSGTRLSSTDLDKIALSRAIMDEDLEGALTLAQLSRRVGLNRTKLALGFKEIYGTSVQAYWRDAKLTRAYQLLRDGKGRVTEVALSCGYAELSSFSRAFSRKFGLLPREFRSERQP